MSAFPSTAAGLGKSPYGDYNLFTVRMCDPTMYPTGDLSLNPNKPIPAISVARGTSPEGVHYHIFYEPAGQTTGMLYHNPTSRDVQMWFKLTKRSGVSHRGEAKCSRSRPGEVMWCQCLSITGCTWAVQVDQATYNSLPKF